MKKNKLWLLISLIGIVCLGIGGYLILNDNNDLSDNETNNTSNNNQNTDNNQASGKFTVDTIKDFSSYKNFKIKITDKVSASGINIEMVTDSTVDMSNKIIKASISTLGFTEEAYYDLNNKMGYYSSDGVSWEKNINEEVELPNYSDMINKVKTDSSIKNDGSGEFSFTTTFTEEGELYENVPVTISFDENGYLKKITYDLSNVSEEYSSFTCVYEFDSVNTVGNVTIPNNIVTGAIQGTSNTTISF